MSNPELVLGQVRVSLQKRVSEEELVTVDFLSDDHDRARTQLRQYAEVCIELREQHNTRIVAVHQKQLEGLEARLENKAAEVRATETDLDQKKAELHQLTERVTKISKRRA